MTNLGDQLRQIADRKKIALETVVRKTVFDMAADMVQMSPVDTGRFRSNWKYGEGSINQESSTAPGTDPITSIAAGVASWKPGETMYVTNSLPYAYRLETGWSKQAPYGMVSTTIANFQAHFSRALGDAKQQ